MFALFYAYDMTGDSLPFSRSIVAGKAEIAISELSRVFRNTSTGGARSAFSDYPSRSCHAIPAALKRRLRKLLVYFFSANS